MLKKLLCIHLYKVYDGLMEDASYVCLMLVLARENELAKVLINRRCIMQKELKIHRRANTALQSLPLFDVENVKKTFDLIEKNVDNLSSLQDRVYKYTSDTLPNTYMMEATPSPYKVVFEANDESVLVQHIIHRDFFTHTSQG
jgi:mRNA-degrading endonuclease RelE of RelBE toxin-antitoxin system